MTQDPHSPPPRRPEGRGLGWAAVVLGVILLLGIVSSVANRTSPAPTSGAATAGEVVGRLVGLALGVLAVVWGVRRLRR